MEVKIDWLKKRNACIEAILWVTKQPNRDEFYLIKKALEIGKFNWINWYVTKKFSVNNNIRYANYSAYIAATAAADVAADAADIATAAIAAADAAGAAAIAAAIAAGAAVAAAAADAADTAAAVADLKHISELVDYAIELLKEQNKYSLYQKKVLDKSHFF